MMSHTTSARREPVAAADRPMGLADFTRAVSESFVPLEVTAAPSARVTFRGRLRAAEVSGVHFSYVSAADHSVERTPRLVARGDAPYYKLSLQLSGTGLLVQDGREALLRPGDTAIYTTDRPYSLTFDGSYDTFVVMVDHAALGLIPAMLEQVTAVRMPGDAALTSVISPFLTSLSENMDVLEQPAGTSIARAALDLTTALYSSEWGLAGGRPTSRHVLLQQIMAHIEEHLDEPSLGPYSIAAANHVSLRYLHTLFQEQNVTVSSWVKRRRLERCRVDLCDPTLVDTKVAAVGARWGFLDAAHFSRTFKSAFGCSPTEMRRRALDVG